jgi:hypothetical protein
MSATAAPPKSGGIDAAEKARLISQFPVAWPWGQTVNVETPRGSFKIKIPQEYPAPKQHKLAYKIDPAPPDVPPVRVFVYPPVYRSIGRPFH